MNIRTIIVRERPPKSPTHLLLLPFVLGIAGATCYALVQIACSPRDSGFSSYREPIKTLIVLPFLLASLPVGLIGANFLAWSIPPIWKFFNKEAEGRHNGSFAASMHGLLAFSKYWMPPFLAIGFGAAFFGR
jgi:hypothetical protein